MKTVRETIWDKYQIDIDQINLLKLYGMEKLDPKADDKAEAALKTMRERWEKNQYSTNDRLASKAKENLKYVDHYEAILRDTRLRKALYAWYGGAAGEEKGAELAPAREFFSIVATTRKPGREEVELFLTWYPQQRKNKKAILEMLTKEFGMNSRAAEASEKEKEEEKKEEKEEKTEKHPDGMIVELFDKGTILKLRKCEAEFEAAARQKKLLESYPLLETSLYRFLKLDQYDKTAKMKTWVEEQRAEVSARKYEGSQEFEPLMDLFNNVSDLLGRNDVRDNFREFKLLVQYPGLTPLMFELLEAKPETVERLTNFAVREYGFRGRTDFLLAYFIPVYEHFGIYDQRILGILKKAKKQKVLDAVDKAFGRDRSETLPFGMQLLFVLANLPLYVSFAVFEAVKFAVWYLRYIAVAGTTLFAVMNFKKMLAFLNLDFFSRDYDWLAFWTSQANQVDVIHFGLVPEYIPDGMTVINWITGGLVIFVICVIPMLVVIHVAWNIATILRKAYDWKGIERTFQSIFRNFKKQMKERMKQRRTSTILRFLTAIALNLAMVLALAVNGPRIYGHMQAMQVIRNERKAAEKMRKKIKERRQLSEDLKEEKKYFLLDSADGSGVVWLYEEPGNEDTRCLEEEDGCEVWGNGKMEELGDSVWYGIRLYDKETGEEADEFVWMNGEDARIKKNSN